MTHEELFADWERRSVSAGFDLSAVRKVAGVHPANFSKWRTGKGGMTLASIQKVEAAVTSLEQSAAAVGDKGASHAATNIAANTAPSTGQTDEMSPDSAQECAA